MRTLIRTNLFRDPTTSNNLNGHYAMASTFGFSSIGAVFGDTSYAITPSGVSQDTALNTNGATLYPGIEAGKTYTISGYVTLTEPQPDFNPTRARKIVVFTKVGANPYTENQSSQGPNEAGTSRVSLTFTVPVGATECFIRFYNGSQFGGPVYWNGIVLEEGTQVRDFFWGGMLESFYLFQKWVGVVGMSASEQYRIEIMENFNPSLALQDAKMKSIETILGPNPVKTQSGSLTENQYAAMEKVLRDNALIV